MRIRTKLLFLFLASGLFLLVQGLAAAYSLRVVGRDVDRLQRYTQTDDLCAQVKTELARLPGLEALAEPGGAGRARRELTDRADRTLALCRSLEKRTGTESSRQAIALVGSVVHTYRAAGRAYAGEVLAERTAIAERNAAKEAWERLLAIQEQGVIEPVGHEARLAVKSVVRRAEGLNRWVTLGGLSLALLLTLASALVLARITAQPIVRLLRAARSVGQGNLTVTVPVSGQDELSQLARAFNDMTQRLRGVYESLEAQVQRRTEELRQREKDLERERRLAAIGRLATGVAHEVSNPLTVIAGAAEGLRDRAQDPGLQEVPAFEDFPDYLETIEREAYRLKRLVRRLLDFSRTKPAEVNRIDMAEVVQDAVSLARLDPMAKGRTISVELEGDLAVMGDGDALKEALLNLLFNALKAVKGGGEVWVRGIGGPDRVVVEVEDSGVGIAAADLERLFEPFFTTAPPGEGTGLGLSLVYSTVERHRGTINARSAGPGHGAAFRMIFPAAPRLEA